MKHVYLGRHTFSPWIEVTLSLGVSSIKLALILDIGIVLSSLSLEVLLDILLSFFISFFECFDFLFLEFLNVRCFFTLLEILMLLEESLLDSLLSDVLLSLELEFDSLSQSTRSFIIGVLFANDSAYSPF